MAEFGNKLSVGSKLEQGVPSPGPAYPDVSLLIRKDGVFRSGPAGHSCRNSPGLEKVAFNVEFKDCGRRNATFGGWRGEHSEVFSFVEVTRTVKHPDVIVLIREHPGYCLYGPVDRQHLRPISIELIARCVLRSRGRSDTQSNGTAKPER